MNDFDIKKVANALILFLDKQVSSLTVTKFINMMFFADMFHLEKYGRSVFSDSYIKLPEGPVPLNTINAVSEDKFVEEFSKYSSKFDERIFSRSEIEVLNRVADFFKNLDADSIARAVQETEGFKNAAMKGVISEESMSGSNKEYVSFWEKEIRSMPRRR